MKPLLTRLMRMMVNRGVQYHTTAALETETALATAGSLLIILPLNTLFLTHFSCCCLSHVNARSHNSSSLYSSRRWIKRGTEEDFDGNAETILEAENGTRKVSSRRPFSRLRGRERPVRRTDGRRKECEKARDQRKKKTTHRLRGACR